MSPRNTTTYFYREEDGMFLGYLESYPDYWTQGEDIKDLEEHLADIYKELTSDDPVTIAPELKSAELQLA